LSCLRVHRVPAVLVILCALTRDLLSFPTRRSSDLQISGRMSVQIRQGKFLYFLYCLISQISGHAKRHPVVAGGQNPLGDSRKGSYPYDRKDQSFNSFKIYSSDSQHVVNRITAEDRHQKLGSYADCPTENTEDYEKAVGPYVAEYPDKCFFLFLTALPPFPY